MTILALISGLIFAAVEQEGVVDLVLQSGSAATALQIPRQYIVNYDEGQRDFGYLWLRLPITGYVNTSVPGAPMNVECVPASKDLLNLLSAGIREQKVAEYVSTKNDFRIYRGNYGAFLERTLFLRSERDGSFTYGNCRVASGDSYTCSIHLMVAQKILCEYSFVEREPVLAMERFGERLKEQFRGFLKE